MIRATLTKSGLTGPLFLVGVVVALIGVTSARSRADAQAWMEFDDAG